jgi:protocatechuate 3,4-dioxygenase beta subunit
MHIHFKIKPQSDEYDELITQVYFELDEYRERDKCTVCKANDPTLVIPLHHSGFDSHWNVYLRKKR